MAAILTIFLTGALMLVVAVSAASLMPGSQDGFVLLGVVGTILMGIAITGASQ